MTQSSIAIFPPVVLWETPGGVRCTSVRREGGLQYEITIAHGDKVLTKIAFERDRDAAAFAIAAMYEPDAAVTAVRRQAAR